MQYQNLLVVFFLLLLSPLSAQEQGAVITKNFKFNDGVYVTYKDFQKNEPTYIWQDLKASIYTNPQTFVTQVKYISHNDILLDMSSVWGVCLGGITYIQQPKEKLGKTIPVFVGLQLRGKICYFAYNTTQKVELVMPVYNPATGRPFRSSVIEREYVQTHNKMMNFDTGEVADFTISNFLKWTEDDSQLVNTLNEMTSLEAEEKLFKCLLIYVDRNEVKVKK